MIRAGDKTTLVYWLADEDQRLGAFESEADAMDYARTEGLRPEVGWSEVHSEIAAGLIAAGPTARWKAWR